LELLLELLLDLLEQVGKVVVLLVLQWVAMVSLDQQELGADIQVH